MSEKRGERDKMIGVWCSPNEHEIIEKKADKTGLKKARYMREVTLGELPQDDSATTKYEYKETLNQLKNEVNMVGKNLNQVARVANQTGEINADRLDDIRSQLSRLQTEILRRLT